MAKTRAQQNKVGRPPKFDKPEEMQRVIDLYFLCVTHNRVKDELPLDVLESLSEQEAVIVKDIGSDEVMPTVSGLAYTLGMSRQALCDYEKKDEFLDTIKRAKMRIERALEQNLYGQAVTGTIFNLKNNFGWKDKTETDLHAVVESHEEWLKRLK
jgi:hypothetical protein